jgi:hypothetical protein
LRQMVRACAVLSLCRLPHGFGVALLLNIPVRQAPEAVQVQAGVGALVAINVVAVAS